MEKKIYSAKRYFIYNFIRVLKNENKILSKKYQPSIREAFSDYLEGFNDYQRSVDKEKIKKSLDDYIEALNFYVKESILENSNEFKRDFEKLKNILNTDKVNYKKIEISCSSLLKKLQNINMYKLGIDILKSTTSFKKVDQIMFFLVNEFVYDGYSLTYLHKWWSDNILKASKEISETNIDYYIDKIENLKEKKKKIIYYLTLFNRDNYIGDKKNIGFNLILKKIEDNELSEQDLIHLKKGNDQDIYKIEVLALDYYKGLEIIQSSLDEYLQLIEYVENKKIVGQFLLAKFETEDEKEKLNFERFDGKILFEKVESREKEDVEDFIKFRDKMYSSGIAFENISTIQRALNILKDSKEKSEENRLLNYWSTIEYILTFHEGASIISKIKEIIPKLICLYYIKDKFNNLWNLISKNLKAKELFNECTREDNPSRYDLEKLIKFILGNETKLKEDLKNNDILIREMARIGDWLTNSKTREKEISLLHEEVKYDLIRIYRTRNILVHSGYQTKTHINFKALRLNQYNNQLLGVIIHYKKSNPNITIEEILNSIIHTYEEYIKLITLSIDIGDVKILEVCKPSYLFL